MTFDIDGARKAGYSDAEIANYLGSQSQFDVTGARKSGYSDPEIIAHLQAAPAKPQSAPSPINSAALNPEANLPFGITVKGETSTGFNPAAAIIKAGSVLSSLNNGAGELMLRPGDYLAQKLGAAPNPELQRIDAEQAAAKKPMQDLQAVHPGSTLIGDMLPAIGMPWRALPIMAATQYGTPTERLINGGLTYLGGKLTQAGGDIAGRLLSKSQASADAAALQNAGRDTVTQQAQAAGYVTPPSQANPTLVNRLLEGFSGKVATQQSASIKNQPVTDALIKTDLGLPANAKVTPQVLDGIRSKAYNTGYAPIKAQTGLVPDAEFQAARSAIGGPDYAAMVSEVPEMANPKIGDLQAALDKPQFSGSTAVNLVRKLRSDASANFKNAQDPQALESAHAQLAAADAMEGLIERNLAARGMTDALDNFQAARTTIAKTHTAEQALNPSGSFVASTYAKAADKGKPLTGNQKLVADFAGTYPRATQEVTSSMPGISPLDYAAFGGVAAALHNPTVMAGLVGRPITRAAILSKPYQRAMTQPQYQPNSLIEGLSRLLNNPASPYAAGLLSYEATR